ncbi:MAG: [FeFe] hydrogenase H-cluster radical SAM maturase HydG [FCB group bacterium]|jgi:2-iminoacetate synthase|nr:[FeFe] hydrogenase H-cluster radical SAM maturase HydG [FCB group bacterium]
MATDCDTVPIDEANIGRTLETATADPVRVAEILAKARILKGLDADDVATLMAVESPELLKEVFETAKWVKEEIYGRRLVLFAPLYVSNLCHNECLYCAFRKSNTEVKRRALNQEEIAAEVKILVEQGHKRVLLVAGESYPEEDGFNYILKAVKTIYDTKSGNGEIRRVNVNIAPLTIDEFAELKGANIGTYQLFQETYHRETYKKMHPSGRKSDYDWRISAFDRAMEVGIDDVGIGVLYGLADWRFETLAMMQHIRHLESRFGVGPHTISVPRLEPACGAPLAADPPAPMADVDFLKAVAILRLAVPYTGIIMSTRENPEVRRATFELGVSQISAGSRTNPGGYGEDEKFDTAQFQLGDHRPLDEVIRDITYLGFVPSFCTACYRLGRTGQDFMDLAKPGKIKDHCAVNALSTFREYLMDYASPATQVAGERRIAKALEEMTPERRRTAQMLLDEVKKGRRDVLV